MPEILSSRLWFVLSMFSFCSRSMSAWVDSACSCFVLMGCGVLQPMGCLFYKHHPAHFLCNLSNCAIHPAADRRQVIAYLLPFNKKGNQNKMLHRLFTLCSRPFTFCSTRAAGPPPPYGTYIYIETHRLGKLSVNHIGK